MTYAFTFDASACSGCKACQVACKDKNQLPVGVLWRRVYEISGGEWQQTGKAWTNSVFSYNLSMACNHCEHPKCAGVCPADAYLTREDGIVYIDTGKCLGCGYCAWACPYSAPQYNPVLRTMTKCNFCYDNIDAGLPPACVAACPLRVLDIVEIKDKELPITGGIVLWEIPGTQHPFPLPVLSRTEPHLVVKQHPAMGIRQEKSITNREEIRPIEAKSELSLIAFSLFVQAAAGLALLLAFNDNRPPGMPALLAIGIFLGLGMLNSLFHLGTPMKAWRALAHLNKSWLSREILMVCLFGLAWLVLISAYTLPIANDRILNAIHFLTAFLGLGLVYCMARVYRLRNVPAWNPIRTTVAFFTSSLILGGLGLLTLDTLKGSGTYSGSPLTWLTVGIGLATTFALTLSDRQEVGITIRRIQVGLMGLALIGFGSTWFVSDEANSWLILSIFIIVLFEEILGRWNFYYRRNPAI